ncbi:TIGR04540 family protein [Globicatella sulfidifaciens]|uniref:TIGR04540 family protein n=1 Tax=Globicatella sulfidifaciens TaxID=136093 RepID=A0A7X8GZZ7_9LACT|nr:TIGR04540 family protein [Globicatella sulfidifaciens]NLJ18208.1 TIGR04540 family protein [Globicatella sulfidifaciens]
MDVKLFYRTQRDLASAVNRIIDDYWDEKITEEEMINCIKIFYENNPNKFVKENKFTTIIQQQCGKRRLEIVKRILNVDF